MNYASTANIEEVMKFYNLGHKTFETDFSYDWKCENYDNLGLKIEVLLIYYLYKKITPIIRLLLSQCNVYVLLICKNRFGED